MQWLQKAHRKANNSEEGFTLIELMIVVVIIGVLAAIAIPIFANQQKAAILAESKSNIRELRNAIEIARVKTSKTLYEITGNNCTVCGFNSVDPLTVPRNTGAWNTYKTSLQRITNASGIDVTGLLDGYGRPISIDENETENGTSCGKDQLAAFQDPWINRDHREYTIDLPLLYKMFNTIKGTLI